MSGLNCDQCSEKTDGASLTALVRPRLTWSTTGPAEIKHFCGYACLSKWAAEKDVNE